MEKKIWKAVEPPELKFDVAASYAKHDEHEVLPIVRQLKEMGIRVYDRKDMAVDNWGKNLVEHLPRIFREVGYSLVFISKHYVTEVLAKVERQAVQSLDVELDGEFLLPIRLDDTELPGLLPTVQHLDLRLHGVDTICQAVAQKLAQHRSAFTPQTPVNAESVSALLRERPLGWEYLLYTAVVWQGWRDLEGKYRDHFHRYAPLNGVVEYGDGLDDIHKRNVMLTELITVARETLSDDAQKELFGGHGDPDDIIHFGRLFVRIFDDFLEWARGIYGTSYARRTTRDACRLQACFADTQLRAMHKAVLHLRASADTLVERVVTGDEIDTSIDMKAVETSMEAPLGFEIDPELKTAYLAAYKKLSG
ncbi:TIR domain-containing protein [Lentzea flava]|nr:TIR domain-containing protein [Lentzea flava]MCP2204576.1 TIR domain-containing protein [Lentzea flava]